MGAHFLLAIYLLITENLVLGCLPREYRHNGFCCPMCEKGSIVKAHCTSNSSSSTCLICAEYTYMDHPNGKIKCLRCKDCDLGAGLIVKEKCTTTSNTVCECKANHYCLDQECDLCQEHRQCQPGQYVKKPGTGQTDTVCEDCSPGHFSNESNSVKCSPWSKCSSLGRVLYKEGTSTNDSLCKESRNHGWIALACLFPVAVAAFAFKHHIAPNKQERNQAAGDPGCCSKYHLPTEETGIQEGGNESSPLGRT